MSDDEQRVIVVPNSDPIYQAYIWRRDSMTLFRLRPILEQLRDIPDQPCRVQVGPYTCVNADPLGTPMSQWCITCTVREIKRQLFGEEQPTT